MQTTGTLLTPWEVQVVRRLSEAYLIEYERTSDENAVPEYITDQFYQRLAIKSAQARMAQLEAATNATEQTGIN